MIIDGETVITGSFNFTKAAEESNTENLHVIRDKKLAQRYVRNGHQIEQPAPISPLFLFQFIRSIFYTFILNFLLKIE